MGTVHIINKSSLYDRTAALIVGLYYSKDYFEQSINLMIKNDVGIRKKGHTFTVVDAKEKRDA